MALCAEQADAVITHSGRLQAFKKARELVQGLGGSVSVSLTNIVDQVMRTETTRFLARVRGDAAIEAEMRASFEQEEALFKQGRAEFHQAMQLKREKKLSLIHI